jgi:hypothetical protein
MCAKLLALSRTGSLEHVRENFNNHMIIFFFLASNMESGKIELIKCFLSSNEKTKCDRTCKIINNQSVSIQQLPFSQISTFLRKEPQKYPIPLEFLEIPIEKTCDRISNLILIGECAVQRESIQNLSVLKGDSSLLLCFCPDSVNEPKIIKKLADLIDQLCITQVRLILAHESCCQYGNTLIEKTRAILGNASVKFSTELVMSE